MGPPTVAAVLQVAAAAAVLPSRSQASQPLAPPTDVQAELKKLENQKRNGHAACTLRADEEVLLQLLEEPDVEGPVAVAVAEQAMELSDDEADPYEY
jgi:hypothetical protein